MAPKRKSSDAGNSDMPKRSRKVLPLSEKVKVLDLIRKGKKSYAEVAKIYSKNESSIREIVKKEKEIRASFAVAPQTAKFTATVCDKCLVKMEKALSLWVEDMNRKCVPIHGNMLRQKALSLYKDFSNSKKSDTKPFTASKGWLHRFRNRFGLKNIKITGEAVSADEEAAATFPTELKKLIKEKGYHPKQVFNCSETGLFWKKIPNRTYIHKSAKHTCLETCPDMLEEVEEHIEGHQELLTNEKLKEIVDSSTEEEKDEEETEAETAMWTLPKFAEVFQIAQTLKDKIMEYDPRTERRIKVTRMITEG
nr:tigger transposable element-derived protein 1-like [Equus asinus]